MAQLNLLKRTTTRSKKRVGRGQSSGRGKTSGRGTKGQNARAGRKKRPELRDIIKKLPKRRGFGKNRARGVVGSRVRPEPVSLMRIAEVFATGEEVTLATLKAHKLVSSAAKSAKVLGDAELAKKLTFKVPVSARAKAVIEKAGGSFS